MNEIPYKNENFLMEDLNTDDDEVPFIRVERENSDLSQTSLQVKFKTLQGISLFFIELKLLMKNYSGNNRLVKKIVLFF